MRWRLGWLALLTASLLYTAYFTARCCLYYRDSPDDPQSSAYLLQAKRNQEAWTLRSLPRGPFTVKQPETLSRFLSDRYPATDWNRAIFPNGIRYYPVIDQVGWTNAPGTALILAAFPQGLAVESLNFLNIGVLFALGMGMVLSAGLQGEVTRTGMLVLVSMAGFSILTDMPNQSLAINALLVPGFLACWALSLRRFFLAGLFYGLCILICPGVLLLLPMLVLAVGQPWKNTLRFVSVAFVTGLIPLLITSKQTTGSAVPWVFRGWWGPNAASLGRLRQLFVASESSITGANWLVYGLAIGAIALTLREGKKPWKLILILVSGWLFPTFIMTLKKQVFIYDSIPFEWFTAVTIALIAPRPANGKRDPLLAIGSIPALMAILWMPILFHREATWTAIAGEAPLSPSRSPESNPGLRPELRNEKAWLWVANSAGTLTFQLDHPVFPIGLMDENVAVEIIREVARRGEPQYWIAANDRSLTDIEPLRKRGIRFRQIGKIQELHKPVLEVTGP